MNTRKMLLILIVAACCLLAVQPVLAQGSEDQTTIYQTSFASDPRWITNTVPSSSYYWVPELGRYYFSIEPFTGTYAYIPVSYERGSFTLEYDVILTRVDEGATFRMGLSGSEMDASKGPNILSMFTNAKYGRIMWLHLVTPGNKLLEINSQSAANEMGPDAYKGATAKYDLNKPYHVWVSYDDNTKILSMKVTELQSGKEIWSYFIKSSENLSGMNRIYLGSKGDYGQMGIYAQGYIDNVRLMFPAAVSATQEETVPVTAEPTPVIPTKKPTPKLTSPTPYPTDTPQSPSSGILAVAALGITGALGCIRAMKKD